MDWIDFRIKKPQTDIVALVSHENGWMREAKAHYYHDLNIWIAYTPRMHENFTLEVTHYLPIPAIPRI